MSALTGNNSRSLLHRLSLHRWASFLTVMLAASTLTLATLWLVMAALCAKDYHQQNPDSCAIDVTAAASAATAAARDVNVSSFCLHMRHYDDVY